MVAESQFSDAEDELHQAEEEKKKYLVEHSSLNPVAPSFYPSPIKKKFRGFAEKPTEFGGGCWEKVYQFSDADVVPHDYGGDQFRHDGDGTVLFNPPVYIQRYSAVVSEISHHPDYKRVVDFGSSTLSVFRYFKTLSFVQEIFLVDVDRELLKKNHEIAKPFVGDFVAKRSEPLEVYIMCGSIADFDGRLEGCDIVTGIEIIEHLDAETLEKVPDVIFNQIRPKMAILTTPNQEFNVLFKNLNGMRHWDHRFEWTRDEFSEWCNRICNSYPQYTVELKGVGQGGAGTEHLGCCTQMAVFKKVLPADSQSQSPKAKKCNSSGAEMGSCEVHDCLDSNDRVNEQIYEVIAHYSYPVHRETRTEEEIFHDELQYSVNQMIYRKGTDSSGLIVYVRVNAICEHLLERLKDANREHILSSLVRIGSLCLISDPPQSTLCLDEYEVTDFAISDVDISADMESANLFLKILPDDEDYSRGDSEEEDVRGSSERVNADWPVTAEEAW